MNNRRSTEYFTRYSRHFSLAEIGRAGQDALGRARVLVVGAGGLGCPVIHYLAAAGIGTLGIADHDVVERSNLQRQVLYREDDLGKPKAPTAGYHAGQLNSDINIQVIQAKIDADNVREIVRNYEIIVDGTDNFAARYYLNDACVLEDKTLVYGSIYRFEGQVSVFNALLKDGKRGPNFRDLFPEPPPDELIPDCAEAGVVGALPGIIGSLQAMEAIKLITGSGEVLSGRLFILDSLSMESKVIGLKDQNTRKAITGITVAPPECDANGSPKVVSAVTPPELKQWMAEQRQFEMIDVREPGEREIVHIGGWLIPLSEVEKHFPAIPGDRPVVVYCKSGGRSLQAIQKLSRHGFTNLYNLDGGIMRWIREVEPELPGY